MNETPSRFVAAAAQMCSTDNLEQNLATCRRLAGQAAERGVQLLVFPECFPFLGRKESDKLAVAETQGEPGPVLGAITDIAKEHGMWVAAGGMPEKAPGETNRCFNSFVLVDPSGDITTIYRKIHLFDVNIPGRATLLESSSTVGGAEVVVAHTPLASLGLSICYDVRFPELYRKMADEGAQVLLVPAAFTAHTGAAHWHTLLRSRAIENQCFVIAAAQYGQHNPARQSYGHSLVFDPWGETLAEVTDGDGLAVAEIDLAVLHKVREQMPCHQHRVLGRESRQG